MIFLTSISFINCSVVSTLNEQLLIHYEWFPIDASLNQFQGALVPLLHPESLRGDRVGFACFQ